MLRGLSSPCATLRSAIHASRAIRERDAAQLTHIVGAVGTDDHVSGDRIGGSSWARRKHGEGTNVSIRIDLEQRVPSRVGHDALSRQGEDAVRIGIDHVRVRVRRCLVGRDIGDEAPLSAGTGLDERAEQSAGRPKTA